MTAGGIDRTRNCNNSWAPTNLGIERCCNNTTCYYGGALLSRYQRGRLGQHAQSLAKVSMVDTVYNMVVISGNITWFMFVFSNLFFVSRNKILPYLSNVKYIDIDILYFERRNYWGYNPCDFLANWAFPMFSLSVLYDMELPVRLGALVQNEPVQKAPTCLHEGCSQDKTSCLCSHGLSINHKLAVIGATRTFHVNTLMTAKWPKVTPCRCFSFKPEKSRA